MPTAQPRDAALATAAADSRALRAALGETTSWRAQAEALARELVEATLALQGTLFEVQRAFAIFPPGSPAGDSLFRLAEALPRIPDRPSRIAMLADRVPVLHGWKAAAALPFASAAMDAIGRQFVYAETIAAALRRAGRAPRRSSAGEGWAWRCRPVSRVLCRRWTHCWRSRVAAASAAACRSPCGW